MVALKSVKSVKSVVPTPPTPPDGCCYRRRRCCRRLGSCVPSVASVTLSGCRAVAQLTAEAFQHVTLHGLHELRHASLGD